MRENTTMINAYFDGKLTDSTKIQVGILSNSLHYGTSVIESIRVFHANKKYFIIGMNEQLKRFQDGIKINFPEAPLETKKIVDILKILLRLNPKIQHPYFRLIYFAGDKDMNILSSDTHFAIILKDLYIGKTESLSACFSKTKRSYARYNQFKISGNYNKNILEQKNIDEKKYEYIIFLGENGEILEGVSENIFFKTNGEIITPKTGNIIDGVNRRFIIESFKNIGYKVTEREVYPKEIQSFEGIVISGSATGVRAISSLEGFSIESDSFLHEVTNFYKFSGKPSNIYVDIL